MGSHKQFKLSPAAYTAMAAAWMPSHADAEVIYTDVVPDVVIDMPGTGVEIDLDGNGINDFNFLFTSTNFFASTYWGGFNLYVINAILATPTNDNAIAAFSTGGGAYVYPYVIDSGIDIGPSAGMFFQNDYQTLLYQFYAIISSAFYYPIIQAGEWIFGETDKFVGLQLASGDSTYYGWARLTVDPSNRAFTIKDLAFESVAETPIETFLNTTEIQPVEYPQLQISSVGGNAYITCPDNIPFPVTIDVFDNSGKQVWHQQIQNSQTVLNTSQLPAGIYIVHVSGNGLSSAKQVLLGQL